MEETENDKKSFSFGFTDQTKEVMVIFVPIKAYSENEDGTALLRGKLQEITGVALLQIQEMRKKKESLGLVKPGVPLGVA